MSRCILSASCSLSLLSYLLVCLLRSRTELPIMPFGSSITISILVRVPQFYRDNGKSPWGYWNDTASIIAEQWGFLNEAASISLNTAIIEATLRKCPHFAWHYFLLVPYSPYWFFKRAWAAWDNGKLCPKHFWVILGNQILHCSPVFQSKNWKHWYGRQHCRYG